MSQSMKVNMTPNKPTGVIYLSQYDVGREITIRLEDENGEYTIPSGSTVTIEATKLSGLGFSHECSYSGSAVTVVAEDDMTDEHGRFRAELKIVNGDTRIGTANFTFCIEKSPHPDGTTDGKGEQVISQITALVERAEAAVETVLEILQLQEAFDGTKATYDKLMRRWFVSKGINAMTKSGITRLCEEWYTITRDAWEGYTEFAQTSKSSLSTGTRGGDNLGLSCTPSTETFAGQDDYAGLPLFACVNVNYEVDAETLDIVVTGIEGITDNFAKTNPEKFTGVMQMSGYHYWYDTDDTYVHGYADHVVSDVNCEPLPEAVRVEGSVRPFVVHSKYMNRTVNGKLTSYAGVTPTAYTISHNVLHTLSEATGSQYSGGTTADIAFLILMIYIKYASLTLDGIMQGCCNYNYQYYAQVSESGVKRIILPSSSLIEEGSTILVGTYAGNADRQQAAVYNVSTDTGWIVTGVEDITIDGTAYKAVYVEAPSTFDAVANGNATSGSTIVSTFHWRNGATDAVLGNDGSPHDNTNGRNPFKCQGIEYAVGGYEILADVIMNIAVGSDENSYYTPHIVKRSAHQATSITSNYKALTDLAIACPAANSWQYIKREGYQDGVFYPIEVGGSTSTFTKDAFYMNANGTTGTREWLAFGPLHLGSGHAGLSCLTGGHDLGTARWFCLARLSPNGNRGEWAA